MAAPAAPAAPFPILSESNSIEVKNVVVATATKYTLYLSGKTGVTAANAQVKQSGTAPSIKINDLPPWDNIYMVMTATNAGAEESAASTQVSFPGA